MNGITMICASCGRPILGMAAYGRAAEPYHQECTRPPGQSRDPRLALLDEAVAALRFYANAWDQRPTDRVYRPDAQLLRDAGGRGRKFLARIDALEKGAPNV